MSSISRVMEALRPFSDATGLITNQEKSNIFLAGVNDEVKQGILDRTDFPLGTLPIRYLGLPLSSNKWSKIDCHQLDEKITSRITAYSRQLSYAGRLQIINVVLFSIYNFWGTVFILPQSVLKVVDKQCRDYLRGKTEERRKITVVAWEKICTPRKCSGLNVRSCKNWNVASVGKLLWKLAMKHDLLWVKWVHGIYIKHGV